MPPQINPPGVNVSSLLLQIPNASPTLSPYLYILADFGVKLADEIGELAVFHVLENSQWSWILRHWLPIMGRGGILEMRSQHGPAGASGYLSQV